MQLSDHKSSMSAIQCQYVFVRGSKLHAKGTRCDARAHPGTGMCNAHKGKQPGEFKVITTIETEYKIVNGVPVTFETRKTMTVGGQKTIGASKKNPTTVYERSRAPYTGVPTITFH